MRKNYRTGMQIYCDCLKTGREVRAKMIKDEIYGGKRMTYGELLMHNVTEWVASNRVCLENFAWMMTWLVAWIVGSLLAAIIIGPRRGWRMLAKLDKACERWMGR